MQIGPPRFRRMRLDILTDELIDTVTMADADDLLWEHLNKLEDAVRLVRMKLERELNERHRKITRGQK